EKYRQTGGSGPEDFKTLPNGAAALPENSKERYRAPAQDEHPTQDTDPTEYRFEAIRQTRTHLTWGSAGGPHTTLVGPLSGPLGELGDGSVARDFATCRRSLSFDEADPKVADLSHTAALKYCVDQASDVVSRQVVAEVKARKANEKRAVELKADDHK